MRILKADWPSSLGVVGFQEVTNNLFDAECNDPATNIGSCMVDVAREYFSGVADGLSRSDDTLTISSSPWTLSSTKTATASADRAAVRHCGCSQARAWIYNIHGYTEKYDSERLPYLQKVVTDIKSDWASDSRRLPPILVGDLNLDVSNLVRPSEVEMNRLLRENFWLANDIPECVTYGKPGVQIDHVWVGKTSVFGGGVGNVEVVRHHGDSGAGLDIVDPPTSYCAAAHQKCTSGQMSGDRCPPPQGRGCLSDHGAVGVSFRITGIDRSCLTLGCTPPPPPPPPPDQTCEEECLSEYNECPKSCSQPPTPACKAGCKATYRECLKKCASGNP